MTQATQRSARTGRGLIGVALLVLALAASALAWGWRDNPLVHRAQGYAQSVATTSAATYVTLRTLNAFLSTAQEIEVGGSLFVSGTVQPLKVLEPIDDTVERIAGGIFVVMITTGVLAVALGPVGGVGLGMVALALGVAGLGALVRGRPVLAGLTRGLAIYGIVLALALPLVFVVADLVADRMTDAVWLENQRIITEITRGVADVAEAETATDAGWIEALTTPMTSIAEYRAFAASIYANADQLVGSFVMILAVFVFKILVLPILLLGGVFIAARALVRQAGPSRG
ncbi:hypothetical protein ILP92_06420 [Maribius pontilimi]|uniref:Uncharacterized protein n=1 Tax=Palleronia pontilimi TaxID=1964209 RepID=A0A934MCC8_9RHOB|nr:hypothetical protein [Palleronia pontilimi]MBJ3762375.1 hypothetical protein [Palleronia pontilimi]